MEVLVWLGQLDNLLMWATIECWVVSGFLCQGFFGELCISHRIRWRRLEKRCEMER